MLEADRAARRLPAMTSWSRHERGVVARYGEAAVSVSAVGPGTVRLRLAVDGVFAPRRSWAVTVPEEELPRPAFDVDESSGSVTVRTDELEVLLTPEGAVDVLDRRGRVVFGGCEGPSWEAGDGSKRWVASMPDARSYYGFGERTGLLEKRGRRFSCWTTDEWDNQGPATDRLYIAVPFFLFLDPDGHAGGLFLHNTFQTSFDLTDLEHRTLRVEATGGELDLYVFDGHEPGAVVTRFTELVGRAPLPPRWALGYHQSRWGYASAEQVLGVGRALRERRIPADAIHLDIDHFDRRRTLTWDLACFPDPAGLVEELGRLGLRTVCIVDPGVARVTDGSYPLYDDGHARRMFLREPGGEGELLAYLWPGLCAYPDFHRPVVRRWWGEQLREHVRIGVDGFLDDMNEPSMHDSPMDDPGTTIFEPPSTLRHGEPPEEVGHDEARNLYAYLENRAVYEFLREASPERRPFILSRSGFAGMQRYAGCWTGDVRSLWEHLEMVLAQVLNLGLSGIPVAGADIGGFYESCPPELLVRWMQLGVLMPVARNHNANDTTPQEPWAWGEEVESACRQAIELRYRLLPYLYSVFDEASRTGAPVLRPLFYHHAADPATHRLSDEALLGRDLLLAPVLRPGVTARAVYLPRGRWVELRTERPSRGPAWVMVDAPLYEPMPLFARAGSILPFGPLVQWHDERPLDPLTLHVFPDDDGLASGTLYEDDGVSFDYERGECCSTVFSCTTSGDGGLSLEARREGLLRPPPRTVEVIVHLPDGGRRALQVEDRESWTVRLDGFG